jgi:hypothetical protein
METDEESPLRPQRIAERLRTNNSTLHFPHRSKLPDSLQQELFDHAVASIFSDNENEAILSLQDLSFLIEMGSPLVHSAVPDLIDGVFARITGPNPRIKFAGLAFIFRALPLTTDSLPKFQTRDVVHYLIRHLPLSPAAALLSLILSQTPDLCHFLAAQNFHRRLVELICSLRGLPDQQSTIVTLLRPFASLVAFECAEEFLEPLRDGCMDPGSAIIAAYLSFICEANCDIFYDDLLRNDAKKDVFPFLPHAFCQFPCPAFKPNRRPLFQFLMSVARSNGDRAMKLIQFRVAAFAHAIVTGSSALAEWKLPAVEVIGEIAAWSEDHGVRFVASPFVEWLCEQFHRGSWSDRALGIRFFLRLLKYPRHPTIVACIAQSDFLSHCVAVIASDDARLAAEILRCFVRLWDGCLQGLYTHPFFTQLTALTEDEEFIDGLAGMADATDLEFLEAVKDAVNFLANHGIDVLNHE